MLGKDGFDKITVTEICRRAEINRGTFYLHYMDVYDVLDDLIDEFFSDVSSVVDHVMCPQRAACTYPLCAKIQGNPKFQPLFLDGVAVSHVAKRLSDECEEKFVTYMMQNSALTFEQARAIFLFQINGCLTVNRVMLENHTADWRQVQSAIDQYIRAGLRSHLREND